MLVNTSWNEKNSSLIPRWLLFGIYFLYLGLPTSASVPLFAPIDWMHEGERVGVAQIVLNGGLPIRDVYVPHGMFEEVLRPLLAFGIFGESLASDRLLGILIAPLPYVSAVFYIWKIFPSVSWRFGALVVFIFYPLQLLPRHVCVFLALGYLGWWAYEKKDRHLFFTGLLTGLGFVFSTIGHALFLLGTVLIFPLFLSYQNLFSRFHKKITIPSISMKVKSDFWEIARPLFGGLTLGLIPFVGYLVLTGTTFTFIHDLFARMEADAYAFVHLWKAPFFPPLNSKFLIWYAIPGFYLLTALYMVFRSYSQGAHCWSVLCPTLLFGAFSFTYAMRQHNYWKLAIVSFPFLICCLFILYVISKDWDPPKVPNLMPTTQKILWCGSGVLVFFLLVESTTRNWGPKEIAPRFIFPAISFLLLVLILSSVSGRVLPLHRRNQLALIFPIAALIFSVWFYNDAKPQVLSAQFKKPKLISDVVRLIPSIVAMKGRITRERPRYVQDDTLSFLKAAQGVNSGVVIMAAGAGIYYFLAEISPGNRFPDIGITMAKSWGKEVVENLERTHAKLLVACRDMGETITGFPMNPLLADFISKYYLDSGVRLHSQLLGDGCPFSVWIYKPELNANKGLLGMRGHGI